MASRDLAARIFTVSNLKGAFRLRSGAIADEYFDKYLFESEPQLLKEIAVALRPLIPPGIDALAGLELGGVPLATVLSQLTGLPTLFVRKRTKEYGTCKLAEGGDIAGRHLLIVEDVVTSGGQVMLSAQDLRKLGARVAHALCVIDREAGGAEKLASEGIALQALFSMNELKDEIHSRLSPIRRRNQCLGPRAARLRFPRNYRRRGSREYCRRYP